MKSVARLLAQLRQLDVKLRVEGEQLYVDAPKGILTPDLRAELKERKDEILVLLVNSNTAAKVEKPKIQHTLRDENLPLSFSQQRLWFLSQLEGPSATYNLPVILRLKGNLCVEALEFSLNEIIRRHEILRTVFPAIDGSPIQKIKQFSQICLREIDMRQFSGADQAKEVDRLIMQEGRQIFDLEQGPLVSFCLLGLGDQEHILLLTMHHIVFDGWSMNVFFDEMSALYQSRLSGTASPLSELEYQYADYSLWQRGWLQGEGLETLLAYWKRKLDGELPVLAMPSDHPRPVVQSFKGRDFRFELSGELVAGLSDLSLRQGTTLFITLLSAFKVFLCRYTGQTDILVGCPVANREIGEIEGLIGFFVNTLVLRTDMGDNPTFLELLKRVRETALDAYEHQSLPFEMVVEALQPERNLSHPPLFQVMFTLANEAMTFPTLPGIEVSLMQVDNGTAKYDLTLFFEESEGRLLGKWEYNSDLFDPATIERMTHNLETLLAGILVSPDQHIWEIPLLAEPEKRRLLDEWNESSVDYRSDYFVHHVFEAQVDRNPEDIAVIFKDCALSYGDLNMRANKIAHTIQAMGVSPDVRVGICMERSDWMVVSLLAVLKAGGAYLPLDPTYPQERLVYMATDGQISLLLCTEQALDQCQLDDALVDRDLHILCVDSEWDQISQSAPDNPHSVIDAENLAYVIYTSGSTGNPKGVMVTHKGLANYISWCGQTYEVSMGCGSPIHSSIGFDLTVTSLFPSLLAGKKVVLIPEEEGVEGLGEAMLRGSNFSLVKITPAHLEILSQQLSPEQTAGRTRRFIIGGEALRKDSLTFWHTYAPETKLINEYGPTETVVGCCVYEAKATDQNIGSVPIGRPISNTQLYILDRYLGLAPLGAVGELYIGGAGVARGYLNRPALTAERFIPDAFSGQEGGRLYKTGDLARYLPDGNIEFLGRIDHQVKIRGYRIELGEIEAVLTSHPNVREAVVVVWAPESSPGNKRLVAYFVAEHQPGPSAEELRDYLKTKLPDYMRPFTFIGLVKLPLTQNGKVDRKALPAPGVLSSDRGSFVSPRNESEKILADIWAQILGVPFVGVHDDFFELGGNSLLSIRVIARINEMGMNLSVREFLENSTIAKLASVISPSNKDVALEFATRRKALLRMQSNLVKLQPGGAALPLFFIHPSGGSSLSYAALARHLGPGQPSFGVEAVGLYDDRELDRDVRVMAKRYIEAIQNIQADDPYYLAGWSFGGLVAFEMAQQLYSKGKEVAFLGLIDTMTPSKEVWIDDDFVSMRFVRWIENYYRTKLNISVDDFKSMPFEEHVPYIVDKMSNADLDTSNLEFIARSRIIMAAVIHGEAEVQYNPQIYPGMITVFRAEKQDIDRQFDFVHPDYEDPAWGWGRFCAQEIEVHMVPGSHGVLMEQPYVNVLADRINSCLKRVRSLRN